MKRVRFGSTVGVLVRRARFRSRKGRAALRRLAAMYRILLGDLRAGRLNSDSIHRALGWSA